MDISKSKQRKIDLILAIASGKISPAELRRMQNPVCIIWDDQDLASDDNIYILGNKRVSYEKFIEFCDVE